MKIETHEMAGERLRRITQHALSIYARALASLDLASVTTEKLRETARGAMLAARLFADEVYIAHGDIYDT